MIIPYLPVGLLTLTLIGVFAVRARSTPTKLGCEIALLLAIGGVLAERGLSPLPSTQQLTGHSDAAWLRALAVVWWLIGARMIATLTILALGRDARSRQAKLFSDLLSGGIYLTAVLIILNSVLDLPINGMLATSGVIAIVLGLALQNTLADMFSGIAVGLEQPFHIGDRITIAEHAEGVVIEMNWRSIRIQTDSNDVATIPNSVVARSQIINRSVPSARRAASVEILTQSSARSDQLMELVRQAILLSPKVLVEPPPIVTIKHLGARSTTLGADYSVATTADLTPAKSQLLRQVRRLFRYAGIQDGQRLPPEALLHGLALFETLTPDQIATLATKLDTHALDPGDELFAQGSQGASLYVVQSGIFEIGRVQPDGQHIDYGRIGPGEYVGEISMMSGDPRPVTVRALAVAEVLELPRTALEDLLRDDRAVSLALERAMQRSLSRIDRDEAARASQPLDPGGTLLKRIRDFLGLTAHL